MTSFLPYGRQSITPDDIQAVVAALRDPLITQGPRVEAFERALAQATGARHAVAFANGTAALHGAAAAARLGEGDEVLTTPISFVASANCGLFVGARPVFSDIDPQTGNLDVGRALAAGLLDRVRACVIVSLAGLPADVGALAAARERGVVVIEDAAHALGAIRDGRPVGSGAADMTAFSLHPVKAITSGEGGVVTTGSDELADRLRTFRTHGIRRGDPSEDPMHGGWHYEIDSLGFNYRITDFQCALGLSQLGRLEQFIAARNAVAGEYRGRLGAVERIVLPAAAPPDQRHAYHLFVVRFPEGPERRRIVYDTLREAGIGAQLHYVPIPAHALYRRLGYGMTELPEAQAYWEQALSLPIFPGMQPGDVERVAAVIGAALARPLGQS
ncbi:MAG TPA: DegT/DnrJ/EryC1/StrS family aminotransferase [Solirubrobacteraceae bacterium]|jgi:UDP-4-amino-4,6-dideoxy-N-acetyl-beta-L-altrosamine transaminase|nr:DegT/DnrJ/EryC1/StrS family aminotransferase [Solirubrobacteraceae bacterium]